MNIAECIDFLSFWVNKKQGSWFTSDEIIQIIDRGQLALYSDLKPKYATSQLIKDSLSPFRRSYDFTPTDTISGYIVIPDTDYLDLLAMRISYTISGRTFYVPIQMYNEDEIADRLNSQIDPVTITSPIGEQTAPRYFRLYPLSGYTGTVTYLKRPIKPVYAYTLISGRIPVYDPDNSVQLEWRTTEIDAVLIKALESIGINLSSEELSGWSAAKSLQNFQGINRI